MSLRIAMDDEYALSKELFIVGVGGVIAGASASGLRLIAGEHVPALMVLTFAAVMGLFANYSDRRVERGHFRLGFSVLAGIVWVLFLPLGVIGAAAAGGAILGLSIYGAGAQTDRSGTSDRVKIAGLYGVALMLAAFTTQTFVEIGFLRGFMHTVVPEFVMGTTWGAFLCVAAVVSRVQFTRDMIVSDYKATIASVGLAERAVLMKGLVAYRQLMEEFSLSDDLVFVENARSVAEDVARNMLVLARKTSALRPMNRIDDFLQLEARVSQVNDQLKRTEDGALGRELRASRAELMEQLHARRELRETCARLETRQQRCITSLERLKIALIQNSALGMEYVDLQGALGNLQDLACEIRWRGGWELEDSSEALGTGLSGESEVNSDAEDRDEMWVGSGL